MTRDPSLRRVRERVPLEDAKPRTAQLFHGDCREVERFEAANRCASEFMRAGVFIVSPISHTHPIALACGLPLGWDFWEPYDRLLIGACGAVYVLMLEGWQESRGVAAEIVIARELGLPVEYLEPEP